jgi:hypothetical protein
MNLVLTNLYPNPSHYNPWAKKNSTVFFSGFKITIRAAIPLIKYFTITTI